MKRLMIILLLLIVSNIYSYNKRIITVNHSDGQVSGRILYDGDISNIKPIILIEGLDISNSFTLDEFEIEVNNAQLTNILLPKGYGLILVNYDTPYKKIQTLGMATAKLIEQVWSLASNNTEPVKVIGFSMGGLVGTWATIVDSYLKTELPAYAPNFNFKQNMMLTFDTPHSGAYIPESIYQFLRYFDGYTDDATDLYDVLTDEAPQQMLLRNGSQTRNNFADSYKLLTDYSKTSMQDIRFTGIINGSFHGTDQGVGYNQMVIDYHNDYDWGDCYPSEVWVELENQAVTPSSSDKLGEFNIDYCTGGGPDSKDRYDINGQPHYENGPGGWRDSYVDVRDGFLNDVSSGDTYTFYYRSEELLRHSFIPSFSAAGLNHSIFSNPANWDLRTWELQNAVELENSGHTHLRKLYHHNNSNQRHVEFTEQNIGWILYEIAKTTISSGQTGVGLVIKKDGIEKATIGNDGNIYTEGYSGTNSIGLKIKVDNTEIASFNNDGNYAIPGGSPITPISENRHGIVFKSNGIVKAKVSSDVSQNPINGMEINGSIVPGTL